jgi:hypothetical protein
VFDQHRPHEALRQGTARGASLWGSPSQNWGKNITLITSLSPQGIGAAMSVEGATDGAAFETYVEHFLVPTLEEGQVVVMDDLQVHKSTRVRRLIEGAGGAKTTFLFRTFCLRGDPRSLPQHRRGEPRLNRTAWSGPHQRLSGSLASDLGWLGQPGWRACRHSRSRLERRRTP